MSHDVSVLIVGAGPTGLMLGLELARRGVPFRIVDEAPHGSTHSKAIGVQARTLEILDDLGLADTLVTHGVKLRRARMYAEGQLIVAASFDELDTRFPYVLSLPQSDTERVLGDQLAALGAEVEWGAEVVSLAQDTEGVTATLNHRDGPDELVRCRWLVGCDGAHSYVRKAVGLGFAGKGYDEGWLLADMRLMWDPEPDGVVTFFAEDGLCAFFPLPGGIWRMVGTAIPGGEVPEGPPDGAELVALMRQRCHVPFELRDVRWSSRFRIHARQVAQYRIGNVFVAGDAAHIHSPAGGQGMNTGIQDAHNLGWKLALVHAGRAPDSLLDSYEAERHGVGEAILSGTDLATRVATLRHPIAQAVRNHAARFLSSLEVVQQRITRRVAELDVAYEGSPLVAERLPSALESRLGASDADESPNLVANQLFRAGPAAGERAPDGRVWPAGQGEAVRLSRLVDGRAHSLLLFDGRAHTAGGYENLTAIARLARDRYGDVLDVHVVVGAEERPAELAWDGSVLLDPEGDLEHRYGARAECLYVLRPDLYVGYRSQPADGDGLRAWLETIFC